MSISELPRRILKPSGKSERYYHGWMFAVAELWVYFKPKRGAFKRIGMRPRFNNIPDKPKRRAHRP